MRIVIFLLMLFTSAVTLAQQPGRATLQGKVTDTAGKNLEGITIALLRSSDSTAVSRTATGRTGYRIQQQPGNYLLRATGMGMDTTWRSIRIPRADTTITIPAMVMKQAPLQLVEVMVEARIPPVTIRHDTVVYHAPAYQTRPNGSVDELLRLLPGVEVDASGNLSFQGQKVTKVYVDGKELTINDPAAITKNFRADMIDKVEAYDYSSEREKMAGIRSGGPRHSALNLKLKKDKSRGVFGQVHAGVGTRDAQLMEANLNQLAGERAIFSSTQLQRNGQIGQFMANGPISIRDRIGKLTPVVRYFPTIGRSNLRQESNRETFLTDSTMRLIHMGQSRGRNQGHTVDAQVEFKTDTLTHVNYTPALSIQQERNINGKETDGWFDRNGTSYLANRNRNQTDDRTLSITLSQGISVDRRISDNGKLLSFGLQYQYGNRSGSGNQRADVFSYAPDGSQIHEGRIDQRYQMEGLEQLIAGNLSWIQPVGKKGKLDMGYVITNRSDRSDRRSMVYNPATDAYDLLDMRTSNNFYSRQWDHKVEAGYHGRMGKIGYQMGLGVMSSMLENDNRSLDTSFRQQTLNWFPRVSLLWSKKTSESLNLTYQRRSVQPNLEQLQPVLDLSNPMLLKVGNPELKPQFVHQFSSSYSLLDLSEGSSLSIRARFQLTQRLLTQSFLLREGGVQELRYENLDGAHQETFSLRYHTPFGKEGMKNWGMFRLLTNATFEGMPILVNGLRNLRNSLIVGQIASLNYQGIQQLIVDFSAGVDYKRSVYLGTRSNVIGSINHRYVMDANYQLPLAFSISANWELTVNGPQGQLPGRTINQLNAILHKNMLKDGQGEFQLSVQDLFNNNTGFEQVIGDNYIEINTNQTPTRYFMLKFIYHIKRFTS